MRVLRADKIIAFFCIISFLMTCTCFSFADNIQEKEGANGITTEDVMKNSIIIYNDYPFFYLYGEKTFVNPHDETVYFSVVNGKIYVDFEFLMKTFNLSYKWSGEEQKITLTDGKKEVSIICYDTSIKENDELLKSEDAGLITTTGILMPIAYIVKKLGSFVYENDALTIISSVYSIDAEKNKDVIDGIINLPKIPVYSDNFEGELKWGIRYWSNAKASDFTETGITDKEKSEGKKSLTISAAQVGYAGFASQAIYFNSNSLYEVSFMVRVTENYSLNRLNLFCMGYQGNTYRTFYSLGEKTFKGGEWTKHTAIVAPAALGDNVDNFVIGLTTLYTGDGSKAATGNVYFDDVRVLEVGKRPSEKEVSPNIRADNFVNWYILGETITMTPTNLLDAKKYTEVKGDVYNSFNELVYSNTVSVDSYNKGFKWKPQNQGYYEFEFYKTDINKKTTALSEFYTITDPKTKNPVNLYVPRQGVVVAPKKTKPITERNKHLSVSMTPSTILNPANSNGYKNGLRKFALDIADLVGFEDVRFHHLDPDGAAYRTNAASNPYRGDFNFDETDASVKEAVEKFGFSVIINIAGSPPYAVPYRSSYTTPDGGSRVMYPPNDMEAWKSYIEQIVKRYKNVTNTWEVWNEPHIFGSSIFWYGSVGDYVNILKTAYEVIKKEQPDSVVTIGGIGARRYVPFYDQFMRLGGNAYFDVLAMHGWDVDPWTYNNIAISQGYEPKPYMTTEGHQMLRRANSEFIDNTEKEQAINFIREYLKDFKYGSLSTTFFEIYQLDDIEFLRWKNKNGITDGQENGLYRRRPFDTPRFSAMAVHTFFENMGKDYKYEAEYLLDKTQNVVRMKNDGEEQLVVWSEGGAKAKPQKLSNDIVSRATDKFKIIDWEGNVINTDDISNIVIRPETVYFITGLDSAKLNELPSGKGDPYYSGDVLYNITERQRKTSMSILSVPVALGSEKPLFDKDSFALSDDINWIDKDWKWVPTVTDAKQDEFKAKYAVSVDDNGMYLAVQVVDNSDNSDSDTAANMWQKDSVQIALDTKGGRSDSDILEFQFGTLNEKGVTLYKNIAPYIGGDLVANFTPAKTIVKNAKHSVERINNITTYKLFMPNSEIYPYVKDIESPINLSVLVNQNDGTDRKGYLEWSSGIGANKSSMQYGKVWLNKEKYIEKSGYIPPETTVDNERIFDKDTLVYNDKINWISGNLKWVPCVADAKQDEFSAKYAISLDDTGMYLAVEVIDDTFNPVSEKVDTMWQKDSVQFAIDTKGVFDENDRIECQFGMMDDQKVTLYKQNAPYVLGDLPSGFTSAKKIVSSAKHSITREDNKSIFKLFLPISELYPYNKEHKKMKFSLLINQNDGNERKGYLEWGSGIGADKKSSSYGTIEFQK